MKFKSVLYFVLALGVVSGAVACATESTDDNTGLNPQPLPPADPDPDQGTQKNGESTTGAADDGHPGSSSSGGSTPTSPAPGDAGTDG